MFRTFLLMLFLCGLTPVSVVLSYRASARFPYDCQPVRVCLPETPRAVRRSPVCQMSDRQRVSFRSVRQHRIRCTTGRGHALGRCMWVRNRCFQVRV